MGLISIIIILVLVGVIGFVWLSIISNMVQAYAGIKYGVIFESDNSKENE